MARDICIALGERIRELRNERGWRQIDLAEETRIHEKYVSDLEQHRIEVGLRTLQVVAKAFNLVVSKLVKAVASSPRLRCPQSQHLFRCN